MDNFFKPNRLGRVVDYSENRNKENDKKKKIIKNPANNKPQITHQND